MKKYFIFALIAAIIMSNCFSATVFAQEMGSPSDVKEILAEAPDEILDETAAPDAAIEESEAPDAEAEGETPDAAAEQAVAAEDVIEEAEAPDADSEAILVS